MIDSKQEKEFLNKFFKDSDEIHQYLEDVDIEIDYDDIKKIFQKCFEINKNLNKIEEANKCQFEYQCFSFFLYDGKLDFTSLSNETLDYVILKLNNEKNLLLKSRYAHILWESPRKKGQYAKIAILSYLKLIENLKLLENDPNINIIYNFISYFKAAYKIARSSNQMLDEVKNNFINLLKYDNKIPGQYNILRYRLISFAIDQKKQDFCESYNEFTQICNKVGEEQIRNKEYINAINVFELGLKIENKLGGDKSYWKTKIAECHEYQMNEALKKEHYDNAYIFCLDAIKKPR